MPEEHISPILCLDSFLGTLPFSLHFSILVVSQRGNVSVTPLSGVTMIKFYFASKTGYKYRCTADTDWMCVRQFGKYFILIYYSARVLSVLLGYQRLWDSTAFEQQIKMTLADPHFLLLYFYFSLSIFILLIFPMLGLQLGDTLKAFTSCCRWGKGTVSTVSHTPGSRQGSPKPAPWLGGFYSKFLWYPSSNVIGVYEKSLWVNREEPPACDKVSRISAMPWVWHRAFGWGAGGSNCSKYHWCNPSSTPSNKAEISGTELHKDSEQTEAEFPPAWSKGRSMMTRSIDTEAHVTLSVCDLSTEDHSPSLSMAWQVVYQLGYLVTELPLKLQQEKASSVLPSE